jgi:hypothetical protein
MKRFIVVAFVGVAAAAILLPGCASAPEPAVEVPPPSTTPRTPSGGVPYFETIHDSFTVDETPRGPVESPPEYAVLMEKADVPDRVRYEELNDLSRSAVIMECVNAIYGADLDYFAGQDVMVGPYITTQLQHAGFFDEHESIDVIGQCMIGDELLTYPLRVIRGAETPDTYEAFLNVVRNELIEGDPLLVRRATYAELDWYWTIISWDIAEPVFVIENDEHSFLIDIDSVMPGMFYIEDLRHLNWAP